MSEKDLGPKDTLIMELPRSPATAATPSHGPQGPGRVSAGSAGEPSPAPNAQAATTDRPEEGRLVPTPIAVKPADRELPPPPIFELSPQRVNAFSQTMRVEDVSDLDAQFAPPAPLGGRGEGTLQLGAVLPGDDPSAHMQRPSNPSAPSNPSNPTDPSGQLSNPSAPSFPSDPSYASNQWQTPPEQAPRAAPWALRGNQPVRTGSPLQLNPLAIGALAGLVAVVLVGGGALTYLALRKPAPTTPASASVSVVASSAPIAPTTSSTESPTPSSDASGTASPPGSSDEKARAALARLRDGIDECVKKTIHTLPGTSPPVPDALGWLKHGPYAPTRRDWSRPFFNCTKFKLDEPMPFMIQWQLEKPGDHGNAIAWIDDDSDGKPERAWGFTARLQKHGEVEFGDVGSVEPSKKIAKH